MTQTIRIGNKDVTIYSFTGKVASSSKNMETKVSGGGGGGYSYKGTGGTAPVRITSTTIVHDQLFLVNREGNETALQLQGFDLACRESNIVTAMWAIKEGSETGPYFAVLNHSTNSKFAKDSAIKQIVIECVSPFKSGSKTAGILKLLAIIALCIIVLPLMLVLIGYIIYFNVVTIPNGVKEFKSQIQYPTSDLW